MNPARRGSRGCEAYAVQQGEPGPQGEQGLQGIRGPVGEPGLCEPASKTGVPTINNCIEEARDSDNSYYVDAIRLNTIANTNPNELTDRERFAWYEFFKNTNSELRGACITLWSEEITEENADKRNIQYGETSSDEGCDGWVKRRVSEEAGGYDLGGDRAVWIDTLALLERPYLSLTITERAFLRDHLERDYDCPRYCPQLFSGRWIPLYRDN